MPVLNRSVRAIPEPSITDGLPKSVIDALTERARVRDLLADVRHEREEVANLHRQAEVADKNAKADVRLRQTGEKFESSAPSLAKRIEELDEEAEVLGLALTKCEDALGEVLVSNADRITEVARKNLRKSLREVEAALSKTIESYAKVQAAQNLISYANDLRAGIVPRQGRGRRLATGIKEFNGQDLLISDVLAVSLGAVVDVRDSMHEE